MLLIDNAVMAQTNLADEIRATCKFLAEGNTTATRISSSINKINKIDKNNKNKNPDNNDQVSKANTWKQDKQMDSSPCDHAQLLTEILDTIKNMKVHSDRLHNLEEASLRPKEVGTDQYLKSRIDRLEAVILKIERVVVNTAADELLDKTDIRQQMGGLETKLDSIVAFLMGPPDQQIPDQQTPPAEPSPAYPNPPWSGHSGPVVYYEYPDSSLHGQQPRGPPQGIPQGIPPRPPQGIFKASLKAPLKSTLGTSLRATAEAIQKPSSES